MLITLSVCEVCWTREAEHECRLCRRRVCRSHFVPERGICAVCYENLCAVCGLRVATDSCVACGKLICWECSVELQPGIRMCRDCLSSVDELVRRDPGLGYVYRFLRDRRRP